MDIVNPPVWPCERVPDRPRATCTTGGGTLRSQRRIESFRLSTTRTWSRPTALASYTAPSTNQSSSPSWNASHSLSPAVRSDRRARAPSDVAGPATSRGFTVAIGPS